MKKSLQTVEKTTDIVLNNKVWQDPDTGIVWQVEVEDRLFTWDESFEYAKKLNRENYGGYSDWKIPTLDELETILGEEFCESEESWNEEFCIKKPLIESTIECSSFQDIASSFYWSSSNDISDSSCAWRVYLYDGLISDSSKSSKYYVRCVRGKQ